MSKKTIELEVIQCDYKDENGNRCANEGDRDSIRICCVCGIDVCSTHSDLSTVTARVLKNDLLVVGQHRYVYSFCANHIDDLKKLIIEKFGDRYEVGSNVYGGVPNATGTPDVIPVTFK